MSLRVKILFLALAVEGGAFIVAVVLARVWGIALFPLTETPLRDMAIGTIAATVPFMFFIFALSKAGKAIPFLGSVRKIMRERIMPLFTSARLVDIFLISLGAGIAEELLFRGVIQTKGGIVAGSILFGVLHWVTPAYAVLATVMGFYIGLVYHLGHSLLIPIQLHCVYDFGALMYLKYVLRE
jgi:membrane protease YdiL (CAAX protease family)